MEAGDLNRALQYYKVSNTDPFSLFEKCVCVCMPYSCLSEQRCAFAFNLYMALLMSHELSPVFSHALFFLISYF